MCNQLRRFADQRGGPNWECAPAGPNDTKHFQDLPTIRWEGPKSSQIPHQTFPNPPKFLPRPSQILQNPFPNRPRIEKNQKYHDTADFSAPKMRPRGGQERPEEAQDRPKPLPNEAKDPPKSTF